MHYELKVMTARGLVLSLHDSIKDAEWILSHMLKARALVEGTEAHITAPYKRGKAVRKRYQVSNHHRFPTLAPLPSVVLTDA